MRESNVQSMAEVIARLIGEFNLQDGLTAEKIRQVWKAVAGEAVASETRKIEIKNNRLYVFFNSSTARAHVFIQREQMLDELNKALGQNMISEMVLI